MTFSVASKRSMKTDLAFMIHFYDTQYIIHIHMYII